MKNFIYASLIAIIIHIVLFVELNNVIKSNKLQYNTTNKTKTDKKNGYTSIKYVKLQKKEIKKTKSHIIILLFIPHSNNELN